MLRRISFAAALLAGLLGASLGAAYAVALLRETRPPEPPGEMLETALGPVHVVRWGDPGAAPVLLLHGTGAWGGLWAETGEALGRAGWHAVAMDLPPFGFTPRADGADYARAAQAVRVTAVAGALGRPVLVAHSFGAGPGAEALLRDPERFGGAVIVAGAIGLGAEGGAPLVLRPFWLRRGLSGAALSPLLTRPLLASFLHRKEAATEEVAALLRAPLGGVGMVDGVADWLPHLLGAGPGELSRDPAAWQGLPVPLALIWGDMDDVTPPEQGEALAQLTGASLSLLEDVGHIPQIEAPEAFLEALLEALEAVSR